jgi:histone H3/H4
MDVEVPVRPQKKKTAAATKSVGAPAVINKSDAIYKIPGITIKRLTRRARISRYAKNPPSAEIAGDKNSKKKKGLPKLPQAVIQWLRYYIVDVTRSLFGAAGYVTDNGNRKTIKEEDLQFAYRVLGFGDGKIAYGDQQNTKRPIRNKKDGVDVGAQPVAAKLTKPTSTPKGIAATKVTKKKVVTAPGTPKKSAAAKA